jgi:hypothetical protein
MSICQTQITFVSSLWDTLYVLSTVNLYPSVRLLSPFYIVHICSILPQIESHGSMIFSKTPIRPYLVEAKTKHAEVKKFATNYSWITCILTTPLKNSLVWITLACMSALFEQKIDWPIALRKGPVWAWKMTFQRWLKFHCNNMTHVNRFKSKPLGDPQWHLDPMNSISVPYK